MNDIEVIRYLLGMPAKRKAFGFFDETEGYEYEKIKNSSNVRSISYNKNRKYLVIEFTKGDIYRYKNVPRSVFDKLRQAHKSGQSVGKKVWDIVRGKYKDEKIG